MILITNFNVYRMKNQSFLIYYLENLPHPSHLPWRLPEVAGGEDGVRGKHSMSTPTLILPRQGGGYWLLNFHGSWGRTRHEGLKR